MESIKRATSYEIRDPEETIIRSDFSLFSTKRNLFINEKLCSDKSNKEKITSSPQISFPLFQVEDIDILDYLGCGSFGKVFKAYHKKKNLYLALKFYEVGCSQTFQNAYEEAKHEKDILDQLKNSLYHPNIVDVFDLCLKTKKEDSNETSKDLYQEGENQSQILILMLEYGKCSLRDLLDVGRVYDEKEVFFIGSKLIEALAFSQKLGISHRDLKPANIILGADNSTFKIADFGVAIKLSNPEITEIKLEESVGTPKYYSPEMRSLSERYNPFKSDVFSLGLVFLNMLGSDNLEIRFSQQKMTEHLEQYPFLKSILSRMLKLDMKERDDFVTLLDSLEELKGKNEGLLTKIIINEEEWVKKIPDKVLNKNIIEQINYFENLADAYGNIDRYELSIGFLEKAQALRIKMINEFHQYNNLTSDSFDKRQYEKAVALVYYKLGNAYTKINNFPKALTYLDKSSKMLISLLTTKCIEIVLIYSKVGFIYKSIGKYNESRLYTQKALEITESLLKEITNPEEIKELIFHKINCLNALGNHFQTLRNKKESMIAKKYYETALELLEENFGPNNLMAANILSNIGNVFTNVGEKDKSFQAQMKSLEINMEILGEQNPKLIKIYINLSSTLANVNNEQALMYLNKALELKLMNDEKSLEMATIYNNIGSLMNKMNEKGKAEESYKKSIEMMAHIYNSGPHINLARVTFNFGKYLHSIKKYKESQIWLERSVKMIKGLEKLPKIEYENSISVLVDCKIKLGDYHSAFYFQREYFEYISKEYRGIKNHPSVISALEKIVGLDYYLNGQFPLINPYLRHYFNLSQKDRH